MRFLQFIFLLSLSLSCCLYASTQTLPAKVWEFGIESFDFDYVKVGIQNGDSFEFVDATGFQLQHIPAILGARNALISGEFITADDVALDTPVVHSLENTEYYFTVHYGVTEKFTMGLVVPYIHRKLDYTDEYISAVSTMEAYANALNIPPDVAYANGIGDGVLTFKYKLKPSFALGATYRGGILQWGTDEISLLSKKKDHIEELATGKVQEEYRFVAYYDRSIVKLPFQFELWYKYFSPGYAGSLDNSGTIDRGDESGFKVQVPFNVNKKLSLRPNLNYRSYPRDKRIEDGHWVAVNNTDTSSLSAGLEVSYWPKRYLNVLVSYTATLTNEISEFDYTFPGRLHTNSTLYFGTKLYIK